MHTFGVPRDNKNAKPGGGEGLMFKNMALSTKMILGYMVVALVALIIGLVGFVSISSMQTGIEGIGGVCLPSVESLGVINEAQTAVDGAENALLSTVLDDKGREEIYAKFDAIKKRIEDARKVYDPLPQTPEEKVEWDKFVPAWDKWWQQHDEYVKLAKAYQADKSEANYAKMSEFALVTIAPYFSAAEQALAKVTDINTQSADDQRKTATTLAARSKTAMITVLVVGISLAVILAILITRSITGPLNRAIASLTEGSGQVAAASGQISSASQNLAEGATEQASSLEESSSALEELASQARGNAEKARRATEGAEAAQKAAEQASVAMGETVTAMNHIKESSAKISGIIKTIEEIAFQTNLLALNAAVEAARAGEHGKGFAVVAEEVRNLAQRSAVAAKDTAQLIQTSVEQSNHGAEIVNRASDAIARILEVARTVAVDAREVTTASEEQSEGIEQINSAVAQMDKVTQQVASNSEEAASASEELSSQAQQMRGVVGNLVTLVEGTSTTDVQGYPPVHMQLAHAASPGGKRPGLLPGRHAPARTPVGKPGSKANLVIPFDEDAKRDDF